jgi:hypothetical protein
MKNKINQTGNFLMMFAIMAIAIVSFGTSAQVSAAGGFFGAIFTSNNDGTTVNQNLYANKSDVYLNGGPQNVNSNGLPDGQYFFQVTDPSGATLLSTDNADCRRLQVVSGKIAGHVAGTACLGHADGTYNPANGSTPVQLAPFSDTPNNGGEYKVHLIRMASNTSIASDGIHIDFINSNSKTDNFKVRANCVDNPTLPICSPNPPDVFLSGHKFYDANANGINNSELPVAGIQIVIAITTTAGPLPPVTVTTDSNGDWTYGPIPAGSDFVVSENVPCVDDNADMICDAGHYWVQTAPAPDSMGFQGYSGTANSSVSGLDFGDICFGPASGLGKTLGYWSNKNGQAVMTNGVIPTTVDPTTYPAAMGDVNGMNGDLAFLGRLNLKNSSLVKSTGNTSDFDPANYTAFRTWLLNGNAVNMAYMLSVQLSATSLDVRHKFLSDSQIVDARGLPPLGITSIGAVRVSANVELNLPGGNNTYTGNPLRDDEEILKNFLDAVNNNRLPFGSATPCSVFYAPPPPPPMP